MKMESFFYVIPNLKENKNPIIIFKQVLFLMTEDSVSNWRINDLLNITSLLSNSNAFLYEIINAM